MCYDRHTLDHFVIQSLIFHEAVPIIDWFLTAAERINSQEQWKSHSVFLKGNMLAYIGTVEKTKTLNYY